MKPGLLLMILCALSGCRTMYLPDKLPDADVALRATTGAWTVVTKGTPREDTVRYAGELLAVGEDSVFLFSDSALIGIGKKSVKEARLFIVDPPIRPSVADFWVLGGLLSTASHGVGLIISAPAWLIFGSLGAAAIVKDDDEGDLSYPANTWAQISQFARFPQGFPPGLDRSQLRPKPPAAQ